MAFKYNPLSNNLDKVNNKASEIKTDDGKTLEQKLDEKVDILSWNYLVNTWSEEPVLYSSNNNGDIYAYTLNGITRYRFIPNTYNPTEDAFFVDENLQNKIVSRG